MLFARSLRPKEYAAPLPDLELIEFVVLGRIMF